MNKLLPLFIFVLTLNSAELWAQNDSLPLEDQNGGSTVTNSSADKVIEVMIEMTQKAADQETGSLTNILQRIEHLKTEASQRKKLLGDLNKRTELAGSLDALIEEIRKSVSAKELRQTERAFRGDTKNVPAQVVWPFCIIVGSC